MIRTRHKVTTKFLINMCNSYSTNSVLLALTQKEELLPTKCKVGVSLQLLHIDSVFDCGDMSDSGQVI